MAGEDYLEVNKKLWNEKTRIHYASDFYDVKSFIKGKDSLNSIEIDLLGNIMDKRILHLQCHFGMDTISLSRYGAKVTGVDFSEESIRRAEDLKKMTGTDPRFIQCDIYSLPDILDEKFDIVFTSYGVVGWLPDMDRWAGVISHFLKTDGYFVMVEFHPVVWMFSDDFKNIAYNYIDHDPVVEEITGTYTDRNAPLLNTSISWNHGLGRVINALIKQGLVLEDFQEYDYSPYDCFGPTVKIEKGKYQIKGLENRIPMLYSVKAEKSS